MFCLMAFALSGDGFCRDQRGQKRAAYREKALEGGGNQSLKGNMWSAIPVALLCMVVNQNDMKQGSGPEGDKVL